MFEPTLSEHNVFRIDLSNQNIDLEDIAPGDIQAFESYIQGELVKHNKIAAIGGYHEVRKWYEHSTDFVDENNIPRNVHLGLDIWMPSGTAIKAPLAGRVVGVKYNSGMGNYGPTIILAHEEEGETFYTLYGHLTLDDLDRVTLEKQLKKGDLLGHIGASFENGGWPAHLHLQLIKNLENNIGDYPGVGTSAQLAWYTRNCPNPEYLIYN